MPHLRLLMSCHVLQEYPLAPLEEDCKLLGSLLDDCLRIEVGDHLFSKASTSFNAVALLSHVLLPFILPPFAF